MEEDRGIGILCQKSKPVFSDVAGRLRNAGFQVRFFHPQSPPSPEQIADLSLIVNKKTLPGVLPTLRHARRTGTMLWKALSS
jgi:hypothetical protein